MIPDTIRQQMLLAQGLLNSTPSIRVVRNHVEQLSLNEYKWNWQVLNLTREHRITSEANHIRNISAGAPVFRIKMAELLGRSLDAKINDMRYRGYYQNIEQVLKLLKSAAVQTSRRYERVAARMAELAREIRNALVEGSYTALCDGGRLVLTHSEDLRVPEDIGAHGENLAVTMVAVVTETIRSRDV